MKNIYQSLLALTLFISLVSCSKENIQPEAYKNAVSYSSQPVEANPLQPGTPGCPHSCGNSSCGGDAR